jgi:hypothetical protein
MIINYDKGTKMDLAENLKCQGIYKTIGVLIA